MIYPGEPTGQVTLASPQHLRTSEVTARSFRVSWSHPSGTVEKYRVVYYPTKGGTPDEVTNHHVMASHDRHSLLISN